MVLLRHLSSYIIHRDIKPVNFLIKKGMVKLGDFWLACIGEKGKFGTPGYVAPEVILSPIRNTEYDKKVDMWSLGAVAHEIITGEFLVPNALTDDLCLNPKHHNLHQLISCDIKRSKNNK